MGGVGNLAGNAEGLISLIPDVSSLPQWFKVPTSFVVINKDGFIEFSSNITAADIQNNSGSSLNIFKEEFIRMYNLEHKMKQVFFGRVVEQTLYIKDERDIKVPVLLSVFPLRISTNEISHALIVIRNNRLVAKTLMENQRLRALLQGLNHVTEVINNFRTSNYEVYRSLVIKMANAMGVDYCSIHEITQENQVLTRHWWSRTDSCVYPLRKEETKEIIEQLKEEGIIKDRPIPGAVLIPIVIDDSCWGFLMTVKTEGYWVNSEIDFLYSLASIMGIITARIITQRLLRQSENKYRAMIENQADMVFTVDSGGNFTFTNSVCTQLTGYLPEEALKMNLGDVVLPQYWSIIQENFRKRYKGMLIAPYQVEIAARDGTRIPLEVHTSLLPLQHDDDTPISDVVVVARDLTERKKLEARLRESELRYRTYIETSPDAFFSFDYNGYFMFVNKATEDITEYSREKLIGMNISEIIAPEFKDIVFKNIKQRIEKDIPIDPYEIEIITANNNRVQLEVRPGNLRDSECRIIGTISIGRDVTERNKSREELSYLSQFDVLSNLYNRRYFDNKMLQLEEDYTYPVGILVCDINGLKLINDTLGHQNGDSLIQTLGSIIKEISFPKYTAARIGGDEFAVIMPGADTDQIDEFAHLLKSRISEYNTLDRGLYLSVAIGTSIRRLPDISMDIVFRNADNAMYRAKLFEQRSARNTIIRTLESALTVRDHMTEEHAERLKDMVLGFGELLDMSAEELDNLALLAVTHDIGKIGVPDEILFKKGPLTTYEWEIMKSHSEIGYRIAIESKALSSIADYILYHHEHWNGKGYPMGLKGEEIPLVCRILAIIDAYDAMINDRPYRKALSPDVAIQELLTDRGTKFQPELLDRFLVYLQGEHP